MDIRRPASAVIAILALLAASCVSEPPPPAEPVASAAAAPPAPETVVAPEAVQPAAAVVQPELTPEQKESQELDVIYDLVGEGDLGAAEERLASLAEERPQNKDYPVQRAALLLSLGRYDEARALLKAALADDDSNVEALFVLAMVERYTGDDKAFRAAAEAVLARDPAHAGANAAMGDIWYEGKDYRKAEASYAAALRTDPENIEALLGSARVQYRREDYDAAVANLDKAIALAPDDPLPFLDRSRVLYQMGRYGDCERDLDEAVRLAPDSPWNYLERGRLYMDTGRPTLAEADFDRSIELDPGYFLPYIYRAAIYEAGGRDEEALADYRVITGLYPDYWYAFESIGVLAWRRGYWKESYAGFDRAATYTKAHPEYYIAASLALMRAGETKAAKDYASKYLPRIDKEKLPIQWLMLRLVLDQTDMSSELELRLGSERSLDLKASMLFYLGSYWLARDQPGLGEKYVRMSLEAERVGTIEWRMAEAELKRLAASE